jgi:hypothetical protein
MVPLTALTRRLDSGLLAALLLCLFTTWPLLYRPGLPNGTDTLYHTYRVAEMDRAWTHGVLLPTWAETFYYGYGSPVFHYYASFTYYTTSLLMRLLNLDALNSLRVLTVLSMLLAGGGTYLFVRRSTGALGGLLAALVYVYSPYIIFTEPYTRGAYPELYALAIFPWTMWAYSRLLLSGRGLIWAALASGLLIITHNLMALVLTGLLAAWIGWQWVTNAGSLKLARKHLKPPLPHPRLAMLNSPSPFVEKGSGGEVSRSSPPAFPSQTAIIATMRIILFAGAALAAGVGLTAYFWLPVMLEQDAARLGNLTAVAQLDYRNFLSRWANCWPPRRARMPAQSMDSSTNSAWGWHRGCWRLRA